MSAPMVTSELYRAALGELEGTRAPDEPVWLSHIRESAEEQFRARGLPTAKDEAWRFTPLRPLLKVPFVRASRPTRPCNDKTVSKAFGGFEVRLHDGFPDPPKQAAPQGVRITSLQEALRHASPTIEAHLGRILATDDGFSALNSAAFEDGLVLVFERNRRVEQPIHIVHHAVAADNPAVSYPRILIILEPGAEGIVLETNVLASRQQKHLENSVTEVALGANARLRHVWVRQGMPQAFTRSAVSVLQDRDSRYHSHAFTFGGALTRLDLSVLLRGPGAECSLDGLYLARDGENVDHHTRVVHATERATSRQRYKGVLDESGLGVFDGTVIVCRGAHHTEAHQENRNLLLSEGATVHTKPHLEIDTDDVRCSHGATVGRLDAQQLFYLRTRGIDPDTARAALAFAFANELVDRVPSSPAKRLLSEMVLSRLREGERVREVLE